MCTLDGRTLLVRNEVYPVLPAVGAYVFGSKEPSSKKISSTATNNYPNTIPARDERNRVATVVEHHIK